MSGDILDDNNIEELPPASNGKRPRMILNILHRIALHNKVIHPQNVNSVTFEKTCISIMAIS
jgi:hypothetical protein